MLGNPSQRGGLPSLGIMIICLAFQILFLQYYAIYFLQTPLTQHFISRFDLSNRGSSTLRSNCRDYILLPTWLSFQKDWGLILALRTRYCLCRIKGLYSMSRQWWLFPKVAVEYWPLVLKQKGWLGKLLTALWHTSR